MDNKRLKIMIDWSKIKLELTRLGPEPRISKSFDPISRKSCELKIMCIVFSHDVHCILLLEKRQLHLHRYIYFYFTLMQSVEKQIHWKLTTLPWISLVFPCFFCLTLVSLCLTLKDSDRCNHYWSQSSAKLVSFAAVAMMSVFILAMVITKFLQPNSQSPSTFLSH